MLSDRSFIVLCTIFVGIYLSSKLCLSVSVVSDDDCLSRGRNCSWCLSDGNCGFCDRCGDHCHKPGAIHSLENCTNCASCIPGTLAGSRKNYECRAEWWVNSNDYLTDLPRCFRSSCYFYTLHLALRLWINSMSRRHALKKTQTALLSLIIWKLITISLCICILKADFTLILCDSPRLPTSNSSKLYSNFNFTFHPSTQITWDLSTGLPTLPLVKRK